MICLWSSAHSHYCSKNDHLNKSFLQGPYRLSRCLTASGVETQSSASVASSAATASRRSLEVASRNRRGARTTSVPQIPEEQKNPRGLLAPGMVQEKWRRFKRPLQKDQAAALRDAITRDARR